MTGEQERALEVAICSDRPVGEIVSLLRQYKDQGLSRNEVYAFLESLHQRAGTGNVEEKVREVADFVAGFCSSHMRIWGS